MECGEGLRDGQCEALGTQGTIWGHCHHRDRDRQCIIKERDRGREMGRGPGPTSLPRH